MGPKVAFCFSPEHTVRAMQLFCLMLLCASALVSTTASAAPNKARARAQAQIAPQTPAAWLKGVQQAYHGKSVSATFSQTYTDAITGPRPTETGTLLASGDGRVRFDYAEPHKKHFVFDGNSAYFYEPEAAQVTIMARFGHEPAAQTMAFLWGEGHLTTAFKSALCTSQCPTTDKHQGCLTLTPIEAMAGVERVDLVIDGKSFEMVQTVVTDALGNRTRYALTQRTLGAPIDHKRFEFVVPPGVSVLHTHN